MIPKRYRTPFVFWTATLFSLLSIALVLAVGPSLLFLLLLSALFNLWSVVQSERGGFVKTRQLRRAYEPARHFNVAQVFTVLLLVMAEFGVVTYVLLT